MRRLLATAAALATLTLAPAGLQAQASFGVTGAYHVDFEAVGVGALVEAPLPALHENVGIMGEFIWFFPDAGDLFEVNGNLTYDFALDDSTLTPFALGGLTLARTSAGGFSSTDVGLNLGGGVTFGDSGLRPSVGGRLELRDATGFVIFGSIILGG